MVYNNEIDDQLHSTIWMRLLLDGVAGARFLVQGEFKNVGAIVRAHWHFFGQAKHRREKRARIAQVVAQHAYQGQAEYRSIGRYSKSIVWEHFIRGKQTFQALDEKPDAPL